MTRIVVSVLTASLLSAPTPGSDWGECPFDPGPSGAQCTTVSVPLDHRRPQGQSIDLHVSRAPARDPGRRLGVLVTSSGGPSAHLADAATMRLPDAVRDRYDIVSFDQRGFGRSAPVRCGLRPDQQYGIPWPLPGGEPAMRARAREIAEQCGERGGAALPYLGTANVARDLDRIRQALGAPTFTFLGISYGTYLGTAYDARFPGRIDRMLLDSTVDATAGWPGVWRAALTGGVETRLPDFLAFAAAGREKYRLGDTPAEVRATVQELVTTASLPRIGSTELRIALFGALYHDAAFPLLATLLTAVRDRDAATAAEAADELQVFYDDDNTASAQLAVFCADSPFPYSATRFAKAATAHPLTGGASEGAWPCAFWPADRVDPPVTVSARGPRNVLLVNNLRDPATTHAGAVALRRAFGDRARLVSVEHGGHGAYLAAGNACADGIGTDFLLGGALPATDPTCPRRHAGLRAALEHLTTVDGATGALAEVRDAHGPAVQASGVADVRTGAPPRARDRVRIFSNTKAFVATVVLQLAAEGRVGLDAPVERYLPGLLRANGNDGRDITVRQLLQHTAGLPDFDSAVFEPGGYLAHRLDHHTPEELVRAGTAKPRLSAPGAEFHYSTTGYVVAGLLIERVTGRPYAEEVTRRIIAPLRLTGTSVPGDSPAIAGPHLRGYAHLDATGTISDTGRRIDVTPLNPSLVWAGGAMISTVADLNTFFAALLGGHLLPAGQLAAMTATVPSDLVPGSGYGLGLLRVPLSCGGVYWGHGGDGLGYQTRGGVTTGGRAVSLVHTSSPSTREQFTGALRAVDTALCEAER